MIQFFHQYLNMWNTSIFLVLFTIVFILADEYIAKPFRLHQMQKKAKTDPEVREALRIAEEVHEKVRKGELSG